MNCKSFENVIQDLARGQLIEATLREAMDAHAAGCPGCGARLEDERKLTVNLRLLTDQMISLEAPQRVEDELTAGFRAQALLRPRPTMGWRYAVMAVAAVILIAFAVVVLRSRFASPSQNSGSREVSVTNPVPGNTSSALSSNPGSKSRPESVSAPEIVKSRNVTRHPRNRGASSLSSAAVADADTSSQPSEVTTPFMPLSYAGPASLQDGAQVVRIELSRSAMATLGLPVNMDRYSERVKADVLVGADGLARAIRFVQ